MKISFCRRGGEALAWNGKGQLAGLITAIAARKAQEAGLFLQVSYGVSSNIPTFCVLRYTRFMARPLRLEFAGALYHVTSRGDRREDIYLDDEDRLAWLEILSHVCARFNWVVHAYCQMR